MLSSCFLNINNNIYINTSNSNKDKSESIKIFDFNGQKTNEIKDSNEITFFIDTYYDNILSKYYIITGNSNYSKSYEYNENNLYHKYNDKSE